MTRPELAPDPATTTEPAAVPDPARDPVGTVRVHPDDDPADRGARRYVRTAVVFGSGIDDAVPWTLLTGWGMLHAPHTYVDDWPVQALLELGDVLGHAAVGR